MAWNIIPQVWNHICCETPPKSLASTPSGSCWQFPWRDFIISPCNVILVLCFTKIIKIGVKLTSILSISFLFCQYLDWKFIWFVVALKHSYYIPSQVLQYWFNIVWILMVYRGLQPPSPQYQPSVKIKKAFRPSTLST